MYLRPLLIGSGARIGVQPSDEYTFLVLGMPVGPYYKNGFYPVKALVQEKYDRCAGGPVDLDAIRKSIGLLRHSGIPHEFRMTIAPSLHTEEDVVAWAKQFDRARSRLTLQNFNPKTTLDARYEKEQGFGPEIFSRLSALVA
jgi:hypothetical protein